MLLGVRPPRYIRRLMIAAFLAGVVGGLVYCLPVSAVNVEIVRRGLTSGFLAALMVSLGAIVGDAVWLTVAVGGAELITSRPSLRAAIGVLGAALLLWLAWAAYLHSRKEPELVAAERTSHGRAFVIGALLCLASPFAVVVLLAVIESVGAGISRGGVAMRAALYGGIFAGAAFYGLAVSSLCAWGRRFVTRRALQLVDLGAAAIFLALGLYMAWRTVA
jgi:threonine/homoserine/homoserine lactone efflux protein